jgi:polyhydroxyalkanoate synthesis repressor PhaR
MAKIIKRYTNRKLYDTDQSSYVTLDEIKKMVRRGEDVQIIDNATKEDLTNPTLAQIIFEQEKGKKRILPLFALRAIIQSSEEFVHKLQQPVVQIRDEVKRRADVLEEGGKAVRDFIESTQRSLDEMQGRFDERIRDAMDHLTHVPEMRRELGRMEQRIRVLEAHIAGGDVDAEHLDEPGSRLEEVGE